MRAQPRCPGSSATRRGPELLLAAARPAPPARDLAVRQRPGTPPGTAQLGWPAPHVGLPTMTTIIGWAVVLAVVAGRAGAGAATDPAEQGPSARALAKLTLAAPGSASRFARSTFKAWDSGPNHCDPARGGAQARRDQDQYRQPVRGDRRHVDELLRRQGLHQGQPARHRPRRSAGERPDQRRALVDRPHSASGSPTTSPTRN